MNQKSIMSVFHSMKEQAARSLEYFIYENRENTKMHLSIRLKELSRFWQISTALETFRINTFLTSFHLENDQMLTKNKNTNENSNCLSFLYGSS